MKRRDFLSKLGIASGVAVVAPMAVSAFVPKKAECIPTPVIDIDPCCEGDLGRITGVWLVDPYTGLTHKIE